VKQKVVHQFEPAFKDKAKQQDSSGDHGAGHKFWCDACEDFRVKAMVMVGNGTPKMEARCRTCGKIEKFVKAAGFWFPESVMETLDNFAEATIEAKVKKMWDEAHVEKAAEDIEAAEAEETKDDDKVTDAPSLPKRDLYRIARIMGMAVSVPMALMAACGWLLALFGIYVHPIYEWIAPYWRPWMNTIWMTIIPTLAVAVVAVVLYAKRPAKVAEESEQARAEMETLSGIDEL